MEVMEAKRAEEAGQGEKRRSECYRGERESKKGRSQGVKVFRVMYLRMLVSLLSAKIDLRSRYPPPISSPLPSR